jgi:hypothetical protein
MSDVSAASSGSIHLYTLRFKEKRAAVVLMATVYNQGSAQWFKFVGRIEFSVSQWFT